MLLVSEDEHIQSQYVYIGVTVEEVERRMTMLAFPQ